MLRSYIAFDVETTGLNPLENEIIEIGALKVRDGKVAERFMEFIHPQEPISPSITDLTGITNEMVAEARPRKAVVSDFLDFCEDDVLVGHNVTFDYSFMKTAAKACRKPFERDGVDTLAAARKLLRGLKNKKLETLCAHYHYVNESAHRAYDDALATAVVFEQMKKEFPQEEEAFRPRQLQYRVRKQRPITEKQKRYLKELMKYHTIKDNVNVDQMSQSEASREIDRIISKYGVMRK